MMKLDNCLLRGSINVKMMNKNTIITLLWLYTARMQKYLIHITRLANLSGMTRNTKNIVVKEIYNNDDKNTNVLTFGRY